MPRPARRRYALAALTLATMAAVAATSSAGTAPTPASGLEALVAAGVPGAVLVTWNGGERLRLARGLADVSRRTPLRASDRFRIGSITKTYVATVVLQLVAEGRLRLDDRVDRWLPGLVPDGGSITLRELLNHSSGIPDFDQDPRVLKPYLSGNLAYRWSPRALIAIASSHRRLFPAGARYSYSNTNYLVAGLIVEAVTHGSLSSQLQRRIFTPLHLSQTSFPTVAGIAGRYAHGYFVLGKPPALDISALSPYAWAAGAIVSTGADVATFYRALLTGRLLPPAQLRQLESTLPASGELPGTRSGLGIERYSLSCGVAWGYGGNFPGYLAYSLTSGDGRRQAVLLLNEDPSSLPKRVGPLFFRVLAQAYC